MNKSMIWGDYMQFDPAQLYFASRDYARGGAIIRDGCMLPV